MKKQFLIALPLAALLALPAVAQQTSSQTGTETQQPPAAQSETQAAPTQSATAQTTAQATTERQPLPTETHEGFWGKLNPFARKKYVARQVDPIKNRVSELDELTASNSKMIKDVDARATEGIRLANNKATEADQHAMQAGQNAQMASQTAQQASSRLQTVEQVVGNLDDYKASNQTEIRYKAGTTTLSKNAKQALDEMVANVGNQRGYIIQIRGFAPGRGQAAIQNSQTMAQSVSRYLVLEHQVPVFRIFVLAMGNAPVQSADGKSQQVRAGRVEVTLLRNGVDQLAQNAGPSSSSTEHQGGVVGSTQPSAGTENQAGQGSMSQPQQQPVPPKN